MAFIRSSFDTKYSAAKVEWEQICSLKEEGDIGLGVEQSHHDETSLGFCAKRVTSCGVNGQCLWSMEIPNDASWTMRKVWGDWRFGANFDTSQSRDNFSMT